MKKIAMQALALGCLFFVGTVVGSAQTVGLKVNIPFEFNLAEKVLPAGYYLILAPQGGTLRVQGPSGASALTIVNQISGPRPLPAGPGAVVFNCYERQCFLARFWTARSEMGEEVPKCRHEKELASEKAVAMITLKATPF